MMTKQDYIEKIHKELYFLLEHAGLPPDGSGGWMDEVKDNILSLLPELVRSFLPERSGCKDDMVDTWDDCLDQIEENLKTWESEGK